MYILLYYLCTNVFGCMRIKKDTLSSMFRSLCLIIHLDFSTAHLYIALEEINFKLVNLNKNVVIRTECNI